MKILNATNRTLNVMMDNGSILTVKPGKMSKMFIASKNTIRAVINAGNEKEFGIILGGSYEQGLANEITGSFPYLYLSEDEAISKLIDPTRDYSQSTTNIKTEGLMEQNKKLVEEINKLKLDIENYKNSATTTNSVELNTANLKLKEVTEEKESLEVELKKAKSSIDGYSTNIEQLKQELQAVKLDNEGLKERNDLLANQYSELKKSNDDTVSKLNDALAKNESMRELFNSACEKFKLRYNQESNEWISDIL